MVTYSLTLTNSGGADQPGGFVIYEVVSDNTTFTSVTNAKSSCVAGSAARTLCALTTNAVAPKDGSLVVSYTVTVNASLPAGTTGIVNALYTAPPSTCVGTTCSAPVCSDPAAVACITTRVGSPISFAKTSNATSIAPGAVVPYNLTLSNTGTVDEPIGFVFYEVVPANTTFNVLTNATSNCVKGDVAGTKCTISTSSPIVAGTSQVVIFTVTVNTDIPATTQTLINAVFISSPPGCTGTACTPPVGCPTPGAAACSITPTAPPISFAKTSNATSIAPGAVVPYKLTLSNTGTVDEPIGFVFYEVVPANTTFSILTNATSNCVKGDVAGTKCTISTSSPIVAGTSQVVIFTVTVNTDILATTQTLINAVFISSPPNCVGDACQPPVGCPTPGAAACSITPSGASIKFAKSSTATSIVPNTVVPYSLTLTNTGSADQPRGFVFYEVVPENTTFSSVANATSDCMEGAGARTMCTLTTYQPVAPGASLVVSFTVVVNPILPVGVATLTNALYINPPPACVGNACPAPVCPDPAAVACDITPSRPPVVSSMTLTQLAGRPTALQGVKHGVSLNIAGIGDTIAYTFVVNNTGNVVLRGISVVDAKLPALNCALPTTALLPGATAVLNCSNNVYTLTGADVRAGHVFNTATASSMPDNCTPAVVPCPSTWAPPTAVITPLALPDFGGAEAVPATSMLTLLLLGLMLMAGAGLVARTKR